jgi:putative membrane protein
MHTVAIVLVALLALIHLYILVLEMFLWNTPYGHKAFALTPEKAELTLPLAKNQGLYNGFLAAGLVYGLLAPTAAEAYHVQIFFTACVAVAGLYGSITASKKILFIQAVPGLAALGAVLAAAA